MAELSPSHYAMLEPLFRRFAPGCEVLMYGSRVTGGAHGGSDLDLVLRYPEIPEQQCPEIGALRTALSESDLPFLVSVLDWALLPPSFREEILRHSQSLFSPVRHES